MGFIILLKFALLCIDFLAWPVIAIGYPLFASIRAIETGSMYHMRKLVIYWTFFSTISLFDYTFVKIIEWIPFWSSIKLVAIFWLVIPQFHGSYYAYQTFVRPFLVVNLQQVINSFYKLKEEQTRGKEKFLDVVERYFEQNGFEALEKLIATKMDYKEPGNSQKDTQVIIKPDEQNVAAASKQLKEHDAVKKKIASPEAKQHYQHARPFTAVWVPKETTAKYAAAKTIDAKPTEPFTAVWFPKETTAKYAAAKTNDATPTEPFSAVWVPKETTAKYAAAKTKDATPTEPISLENRHLTMTIQKAEPEWTCPLCQVTTTCESNLKFHLRGIKHKTMCESLKSSKLSGLDHGPSSTEKDATPTEPIRPENGHLTTTPQKAKLEWTCLLCQVTTSCESNLEDHLRGKKHKTMYESLKSSKLSGLDTGPSSIVKQPSSEAGKNQVWRRIPEKIS